MSFLNPLLLAGLGAIAVPVLIHLLNRHRLRRITWAAMRFLRISVERNERRMHIEDWLLLCLRCLLLILLALALARPTFQGTAAVHRDRAPITGFIILDNSLSMGATDGVQSRFDRARRYAETILDTMPGSSATAVLLASDVVRGLIPEPTRDLNLARKTLRDAPLSDRSTSLLPALRLAVETLQRRGGARREIYLLTDAQTTGFADWPATLQLLQEHKADIHLNVIVIRDPENHNLSVSDLRATSGLMPVDQPLRFDVQVTNHGREDARDVSVRLSVDNEPPADQAHLESLLPGAAKSVPLFAKLPSEGFHTVTAEIDGDRLTADNRRTLAVNAQRRFRVLLVNGRQDNETFYLRHALAPVDPVAAGEFYIEPVLAADPGASRLDAYAAVVLVNVPDVSQATATALEQYVRRGGGLLVFAGDAVNSRFYNDELFGRYGFLPARFGPLREAQDEEHPFHFQAKDYDHPITALWNDPAAGTLASARFYKAYTLEPATNGTRVVARFADGAPAIVERIWGQGRVVQFASSANTAWNDLPVRPAFVPLLHRTLGALEDPQFQAFNVRVGDRLFYRTTEEALGKDATIAGPGSLPQYRRVELVDGRPVLSSEETEQAGAYAVTIQTEPPVQLKFAAQPNPAESQLEPLTAGQLTQLETLARVVEWQPDAGWKEATRPEAKGREIWRALVFAALVLAAAELFLAQRFSEPK